MNRDIIVVAMSVTYPVMIVGRHTVPPMMDTQPMATGLSILFVMLVLPTTSSIEIFAIT
jgi:hypothetical protein